MTNFPETDLEQAFCWGHYACHYEDAGHDTPPAILTTTLEKAAYRAGYWSEENEPREQAFRKWMDAVLDSRPMMQTGRR